MESKIPVFLRFLLVLCMSFCVLLWFLTTISISHNEAIVFFEQKGIAGFLSHLSVRFFGQNDFGLRLPFLILHLCNAYLMFIFARGFLKLPSDAVFCVALFCLLPGVNAVALLVTNCGIVIFITLLLCILAQKYNKIPYWLLFIAVFIDKSFALVFLSLIFYAISRKDTRLLIIAVCCFALNMYMYGLDIGGHPQEYFPDGNAHLLLIFSPLVFLYFLYCLYRYFNIQTKPLIWYIAFCTLCFIWIVSLRQRVSMEDCAPLLLVGIPLMVRIYFTGLRVRLPQFRMRYKLPFSITFFVLVCMSGTLLLSKPLFVFFPDVNEHFAHRHFIAKELAESLKNRGFYAVKTDENLQMRLRFYGISFGGHSLMSEPQSGATQIPIVYYYIK